MFAYMCVRWVEGCFNLAPAGRTWGDQAANTNTLLSPTNRPWSTLIAVGITSQNNTNTNTN